MSKPKAERVNILEDYQETHEELPRKLEENFLRIRELDARQHGLTQTLKDIVDERIREAKATPTPKKNNPKQEQQVPQALLERVTQDVDDMVRCNEQKFELARSSYDLIDDHIRRLDEDLAAFEDEYYAQTNMTTDTAAAIVNGTLPLPSHGWGASGGHGGHGGSKHGRPAKDSHKRKAADYEAAAISAAPNVEPAPAIDPAEPTYCTCGRFSFGNMVSCDAEDCKIEWFHFECVGIPAGTILGQNDTWFCPECQERLGKVGTMQSQAQPPAQAGAAAAGGAVGAGGGAAGGMGGGGGLFAEGMMGGAPPPVAAPPPRAPRSKKQARRH